MSKKEFQVLADPVLLKKQTKQKDNPKAPKPQQLLYFR